MAIPREFIQQLLSRIEIIDLIDSYMPLRKKSGNNYFACCPFHGEKTASFSVSQVKQFYYCFGCGAHGNAIDFVLKHDRLSFPEAIEKLAHQAGLEVPKTSTIGDSAKKQSFEPLYALMGEIATYYQQQLKTQEPVIQYLKDRGLSGKIAKEFEVGFALPGWDNLVTNFGDNPKIKEHLYATGMLIKKDDGKFYDRFRERIMFPIRNRQGQVVAFGGRVVNKGEPKYLNSPETVIFQKSHELYGLYQALQLNRELEKIIIVEGYMDVIALFQHEITFAVATLGTATNAHHLQKLFRYSKEIIFCFDGDQPGRTAATRALHVALPLINDEVQIKFLFLPEKEDPDSLVRKEGKDNFLKRLNQAPTLSQFFFQAAALEADLTSMDGRAKFVATCTEYLKEIPETVFKTMMFDELAKRARIEVAQIQPKNLSSPKPRSNSKLRTPSNIRLAITLLIQNPSLARVISAPLVANSTPGYTLLSELIEVAKTSETATTGALLEHWRDREEGATLAKLALTEHEIPEAGIEQEFLGAITQLQKNSNKNLIDQLIAKANQGLITAEEKVQLQELIYSK